MPPIFAAAAAIFSAVAGALGGAGAIIGSLLQVGLAIGISAISNALAPKPGLRGSSIQVSLSATDPRRVVIGRTATAGALVTFQTWGENNKWIVLLFRVADHKCTALNSVYWGGNLVSVGGGGAVSQFNKDGADHLWVTFMDGTWNQAANADMIANSGGRWTSADKGQGIAYVEIKALANDKAFPGGINDLFQFLFVIDGAPFYDRRLDTSVGGSGTQRLNDQSTWTLNANASVVTENFLRGFRAEDTTTGVGSRTVDYFMGLKLPDNVLPFAENVAAMNHCDEAVGLNAGGTEPRYKVGGVITADQTGDTILGDLLAAQAGKMLTGPARFVLLPGVTQSSVRTFTDGDLRLDGPYAYTQDIALDTIVNAVTGQFLDSTALYTAQPLPPRTSSSDEAEDGGYKADTFDVSYATSQTQGQRVQEIHRRRSRRQRTETITVGPENLDLEGGDWTIRNSARLAAAWGGTLGFEITQVQPIGTDREDELLQVILSLQEVDSGVFSWTPSTDELSYTTPTNLSSADPTDVNVTSLTAAATTISSVSGTLPAIAVTRDGVTDTTVIGVIYQYQVHGTPTGAAQLHELQFSITPGTESGTISNTLAPGVVGSFQYDVRAAYVTKPASDLTWSAWVTTSAATAQATTAGATPIADGTVMFDSAQATGSWSFPIPSNAPGFVWIEGWAEGGANNNSGGKSPTYYGGGEGQYFKHHVAVTAGTTVLAGTIGHNSFALGVTGANTTVTSPALTAHGGVGASTSAAGAGGSGSTGANLTTTNGNAGGSPNTYTGGGGAAPDSSAQTSLSGNGNYPGGGSAGLGGAVGVGRIRITAKTT